METKKKAQHSTNLEIFDYGTNWLIKNKIKKPLFNFIKNFFEVNQKFLTPANLNNLTTTGNAEQFFIYENNTFNNDFLNKNLFVKAIKILEKNIKKNLNFLNLDNFNLNLDSIWFVNSKKNSYQTIHTHEICKEEYAEYNGLEGVSAIIYINTENISINERDGNTYFIMNSNPKETHFDRHNVIVIQPKNQEIIIFPNHLYHGTYPHFYGERLILSINFRVEYFLN